MIVVRPKPTASGITMGSMDTAIEKKLRRADTLEGMFNAALVMNEAGIPHRSPETKPIFDMLLGCGDQATMRRHLREATAGTPTRKTYAAGARALMAKDGRAMSDGSVAIKDAQDVQDAVDDWARTGSDPDVKAHIIQAAKKVGATAALPEDWDGSTRKLQESAKGLSELGIPTIGPEGVTTPARLREARTADELAQHGIPILSDSPVAGQRQRPNLEAMGIPLLPEAPGTSALRRIS